MNTIADTDPTHGLTQTGQGSQWEDGGDVVVKRDRPGFIGDLSRKVDEKGILL